MNVFWRILDGDCVTSLRELDAGSVQTCVTSPPYFGLRDYGHEAQIGLESTPDAFVSSLVGVFREVRRVLRDDGTVWLNLGDSYAATSKGSGGTERGTIGGGLGQSTNKGSFYSAKFELCEGTKPKDLLGIPWLVAFALRADGWYLRSDIIWHKPNPMPESVTDRPTKAHEYLFLLSKSARYFYDADAIAEDAIHAGKTVTLGPKSLSRGQATGANVDASGNGLADSVIVAAGRNKRSVWTVATQPYSGAHFATFPPNLIEPCILAGSPGSACGTCGAPWVRVVERERTWKGEVITGAFATDAGKSATAGPRPTTSSRTLGFEPSCHHDDGSGSSIVLDPFAGSGTTGMVALRHGRSFIGCELNPTYAQMARERITDDAPLLNAFAEVADG